jgi:hypothetical protein
MWKSEVDYDSKKEKDTRRASLSIENREPRSLSKNREPRSLSIENRSLVALYRKSRAQVTLSNPESLALYRKPESIVSACFLAVSCLLPNADELAAPS